MEIPFDSVKGQIFLSAIPVVLVALWADYFERHLGSLSPEQMEEEREDNVRQNRLVTFCGLVAQVSASLVGYSYWRLPGWITYLILLGAAGIQASTHLGLDKKLAKPGIPRNAQTFGLQSLLWVFVDIAIYWVVVLAFVGLAAWMAPSISKDTGFTELSMFVGGIVGMFAGIGINYALAPVFFKRMFPTRPLEEPYALQLFGECFKKAGINEPQYLVIDMDHFGFNNAMIAGFRFGRGPFRPALFVTHGLLKDLTRNELESVILHEVSHLALNHIMKRFVYGFLSLIGATIVALAVVAGLAFVLPPSVAILIGVVVMLMPFATPFLLIRRLSKTQEFEADAYAITHLGASANALVTVLKRLEQQHQLLLNKMRPHTATREVQAELKQSSDSHPATADRINAILRLNSIGPSLSSEAPQDALTATLELNSSGDANPNTRPKAADAPKNNQDGNDNGSSRAA